VAGYLHVYRHIARNALRALRGSNARVVGRNQLGQETLGADEELEKIIFKELSRIKCAVLSEEAGYRELALHPKELFVIDPLDASENYRRGIPNYALGIARAPAGGRLADVEEAYIFDLASGEEFYSVRGEGAWKNGRRAKPSQLADISEAIVAFDFYNVNARPVSNSTRALALSRTKDIRRFGPALLEMAYVGCGSLEGYFNINRTLSVVHASGPAFMRHAGCIVTDSRGRGLDFRLERIDEYFTIVAAGIRQIHDSMMEIARG